MDDVVIRIASSKPFRFTVGANKREFTIHSALVARQSPRLEALVKGSFSEARDGHAVFDPVDENIFALFVEYAYTGHYGGVDQCTPRPFYCTDEDEALEEEEWASESGLGPSSDNKRPSKRRLWIRFIRRTREFQRSRAEAEPELGQAVGGAAARPSIDDLLQHAKLYIFADYYGIYGLMDLALNHLGQALTAFEFRARDTGVILAMLRFCYDTPAPEALKSLIVLYAACKAEILWKDKGFQELVVENRELAIAFIGQVMGTGD
jgi:hypothetical protein